jgi:UDP-N-acetylmuramyl pentapeptide phosphotransferase/UDP-N-acetylglucosamine-1-phosphate transferase
MTSAHMALWAGCCVLTAALTWAAILYARRAGLIDAPGERRSHVQATPRGAGISIVVVMALACVSLFFHGELAGIDASLAVAGLALVAVPGWIDDHRSLPVWPRLLAHGLAAACVAVLAWRMSHLPAHAGLAFLATLALINIWNFMDGINGLAATQAALAACGFAALAWPSAWAVLAVCLSASALGFLPFNFPRARIFLGDVGSGSLGYLVALFGVLTLPVAGWSLAVLLPVTAFGIDAGFTLSRRMLAGERWWTPHASHAYQRLARRLGHPFVTYAYGAFTACAVLVMLRLVVSVSLPLVVLALLLLGSAGMVWWKITRHWA